jgi:hypothetical protein
VASSEWRLERKGSEVRGQRLGLKWKLEHMEVHPLAHSSSNFSSCPKILTSDL